MRRIKVVPVDMLALRLHQSIVHQEARFQRFSQKSRPKRRRLAALGAYRRRLELLEVMQLLSQGCVTEPSVSRSCAQLFGKGSRVVL